MTKRRRAKQHPPPRPAVVPAQAKCGTCGRFRLMGEICWSCNPPTPAHCHCEDSLIKHRSSPPSLRESAETCGGHVHLRHAWLERQWQVDLESVDEAILLPTEMWGDDETHRSRQARRDDPDYKAWIRSHPQLLDRSRRGVDALYAFFGLTGNEGVILSKDAQGYTPEGIAEELGYKAGGVENLLASARSKVAAKMARISRDFARAV